MGFTEYHPCFNVGNLMADTEMNFLLLFGMYLNLLIHAISQSVINGFSQGCAVSPSDRSAVFPSGR